MHKKNKREEKDKIKTVGDTRNLRVDKGKKGD